MRVTVEAIDRYIQRIRPVPWDQAREEIEVAVLRARPHDTKSGARRLYDETTRALYVMRGDAVVTVCEPFWV